MLEIKNLVKKYGTFTAVDNLNLELEKGGIYGFVGPNGAGKTTTMRVVATLLEATSGTVLVDGINVAEQPVKVRGKIGYMPDFFGVYDNLKVEEYMDFYGSCYGLQVADRPGVLGKITTAFGRNGVSLESVVQRGRGGSSVPLIFVTHEAERDKLNAALNEIREMNTVEEVASILMVQRKS
jgi:ABC-2 type transport system ATP-binding protein